MLGVNIEMMFECEILNRLTGMKFWYKIVLKPDSHFH